MRQFEKEIHKLVYDEYGDVLDAKDKEIENNYKEITKLTKDKEKSKRLLKKLKQMDDLNQPKAQKIINTLIQL